MKKINDYTEAELSAALLKKINENKDKIGKKEISDAIDILEFVKKNDFFMFSYPSKCSAKLYAIDKEQLPKINEYNSKEVKIKLDRYVEINGNFNSEISSNEGSTSSFKSYTKKYKKLPRNYEPKDDDGNDSSNPSYFWPKLSFSEKRFLVPISKEMFDKIWKSTVVYGDEIDLMIKDLYNGI